MILLAMLLIYYVNKVVHDQYHLEKLIEWYQLFEKNFHQFNYNLNKVHVKLLWYFVHGFLMLGKFYYYEISILIEFFFYFLDENVVILVKQRLKFLMNISIHIYQIRIQVKKQKKNLLVNVVLVCHR